MALVVLGATAQAGGALAQAGSLAAAQSNVDLFARDRSVAVRDRPHPEYEAMGMSLGAFSVFPRVELGADVNDNVYATAANELDDVIFFAKPGVSLASNWSRHSLGLYANGTITRYQDYGSEDTEDWTVGGDGVLDVVRGATIGSGASYASLSEPRSAASAAQFAVAPIEYSMAQAYLNASRAAGRIKVSGRGDWKSFDYDDGMAVDGSAVEQDDRDRDIYSLTGRVDYAISPATALFFQATGNERDYSDVVGGSPPRDSSGFEILTGANFELGAVSRGEIAVGYISQDFDNAAYNTIDGFGARAVVEWFPTQLTTVTATASRTIEDAGAARSGGYLSSAAGLQLDHELRRNVILGAGLTYSQDEYDGIDREDTRVGARVSATYLVNRRLGVNLAASHLEQTSDGAGAAADYTVNRLILSLITQF